MTKFYTFEPNQQSPYLPKSSCNLLTIDSQSEESYIFYRIAINSVFATNKEFYIDGVRSNGQWIWQQYKTPITYGPSWRANQPDNKGGQENCLTISKASDVVGINDFGCNFSNVGLICQEVQSIPAQCR